ncbi:hypothetical protein Ancab_005685 [Ancistrocladus abbreviatus]
MDPWIPSLNGIKPHPRSTERINPSLTAVELMNEDRLWDKQILGSYFDDNSVEHIMKTPVTCKAVQLWLLFLGIDAQQYADRSMIEWLEETFASSSYLGINFPRDVERKVMAAALLDHIWQTRNKILLQASTYNFEKLIWQIQGTVELWREASEYKGTEYSLIQTQEQITPINLQGRAIFSFDVGISNAGSYQAFIKRNDNRDLIGAMVQFNTELDPLATEAMAYLEVIKEVREYNYQKVSIVGDCKLVIDAINKVTIPPWSIAHIVSEIQCLSELLVDVEFVFVGHSLNATAHELCNWGKALGLKGRVVLNTLPEKAMSMFAQESNPATFGDQGNKAMSGNRAPPINLVLTYL